MHLARRLAGLAPLVLVGLLAPSPLAPAASASHGGTHVGGILRADTTWTAAGSPYVLDSTVQVPAGIALRIEKGVEIRPPANGAESFLYRGSIAVAGTKEAPVRLTARPGSLMFHSISRESALSVQGADLRQGRLWSSDEGGARLSVLDSTLRRMDGLWVNGAGPTELRRNGFLDSGMLSLGVGSSPVEVTDNYFSEAPDGAASLENTYGYSATLEVHGNTFAGATTAVRVSMSSSTKLDATRNYWGTTDPDLIAARIDDDQDDIRRSSTVPFAPALEAASPTAPVFTPPSAVTDLRASSAPGSGSLEMSWQAPLSPGTGSIDGYHVRILDSRGSYYPTPDTMEMSYRTHLPPGTYRVEVRAKSPDGRGALSAVEDITVTGYDDDRDGVPATSDNCPEVANPFQHDYEGDKVGDVCDPVDDVRNDTPMYPFMKKLVDAGVTSGCSASGDLLLYCPTSPVKRGDMAVFLARASLTPAQRSALPAYEGGFSDVEAGDYFSQQVRYLADSGVTAGCGGGRYCPQSSVLRGEMSIFLARTKIGAKAAAALPAYEGGFSDVTSADGFSRHVRWVKEQSITSGCGGGAYCPGQAVTRDQMAVFLVKTFGL